MKARVVSTGTFFPKKRMDNEILEQLLDMQLGTAFKKTGVRTRHIITDETPSELVIGALRSAGIPDRYQPSVIAICGDIREWYDPGITRAVQSLLPDAEIPKPFFYCPAPLQALKFIRDRIESGIETGAVVAYSTASRAFNSASRDSLLWGDGAGAAVLQASDNGLESFKQIYSDKVEAIKLVTNDEGQYLVMPNDVIFPFLMENLPKIVNQLCKEHCVTTDGISAFVFHQPCGKTLAKVAKYGKIPMDKVILTSEGYGNLVGASFFVALDAAKRQGLMQPGSKQVFSTFGVSPAEDSIEINVMMHYS